MADGMPPTAPFAKTVLQTSQWIRLAMLFATIYVVQGIIEPTTGLVAEPVESMLKHWGETPVEIATFLALVGLPWCLKPLFGFLSDFRPLRGSHRRSYLLLAAGIASVAFLTLGLSNLTRGEQASMTGLMFLITMAVAASDVILDAQMIDVSQPLGITSRIQSVQYGASYAGAIAAGVFGGILSEEHRTGVAFLVCGILMAVQWWVMFRWVREARVPRKDMSAAMPLIRKSFRDTLRSRSFRSVAFLMALYHLNPFTQATIYLYLTGPLQLDDAVYGESLAWISAGGFAATVLYGMFLTRLPIQVRTHIGLAAGVFSSLAYLGLTGEHGLSLIGMIVGVCQIFGGLALIDLAARCCPSEATATVYASLMSLCNLCAALATWLGGELYSTFISYLGPVAGFRALIWAGAAVTAMCWFILPMVPWADLDRAGEEELQTAV